MGFTPSHRAGEEVPAAVQQVWQVGSFRACRFGPPAMNHHRALFRLLFDAIHHLWEAERC